MRCGMCVETRRTHHHHSSVLKCRRGPRDEGTWRDSARGRMEWCLFRLTVNAATMWAELYNMAVRKAYHGVLAVTLARDAPWMVACTLSGIGRIKIELITRLVNKVPID